MDVSSFGMFVDEALHIATPSLPSGVTGQEYRAVLEAAGGGNPAGRKWLIRSGTLPDGLSLLVGNYRRPENSLIGGVPAQKGRFDFVVQADNADGETDSKPLSIVVTDPLKITILSLAVGLVNRPYSDALTASGGVPPYVWSVNSAVLPRGLTLDQTTGTVWKPAHGRFVSNHCVAERQRWPHSHYRAESGYPVGLVFEWGIAATASWDGEGLKQRSPTASGRNG